MNRRGVLAAACAVLAVAIQLSGDATQERLSNLPELAVRLDLTGAGARGWLDRLGATADDPPTERLQAVSLTGARLLERLGRASSVPVDAELNTLLLRPDVAIVLVHNHPANVGLSVSDLRQLAKPGVASIVAVGHDSSVFMASAGARLDRDAFEQQYSRANAEIWRRLRPHLASGRVPIAVSELHGSHLVTLALGNAGILEYWFELRGSGRDSYETCRMIFSQAVAGAAGCLRRD